jgi:hypothetical protein
MMSHQEICTVLYTYEDGKALPEHGGCVNGITVECGCIEWLIFADLCIRNIVVNMSYLLLYYILDLQIMFLYLRSYAASGPQIQISYCIHELLVLGSGVGTSCFFVLLRYIYGR